MLSTLCFCAVLSSLTVHQGCDVVSVRWSCLAQDYVFWSCSADFSFGVRFAGFCTGGLNWLKRLTYREVFATLNFGIVQNKCLTVQFFCFYLNLLTVIMQ